MLSSLCFSFYFSEGYMVNQAALDRNLSQMEGFFNIAGYIPVVSSVTGAARILYGKIEVVAGIAAAAFLAIKALFSGDRSANEWFDKSLMALDYAIHGAANVIRGYIEIVPFFGLLLCLPYDRCFNCRLAYPTEVISPRVV
jgi:hypothetical protein